MNHTFATTQDAAIDVIGIIECLTQEAMRACQTTYRGEVADPDLVKDLAERMGRWSLTLAEYADDMPHTDEQRLKQRLKLEHNRGAHGLGSDSYWFESSCPECQSLKQFDILLASE